MSVSAATIFVGGVYVEQKQTNLAESLLEEVLSLIKQDIGHIKALVNKDKLSHYAATDLSRYCKVLQDVQADEEDEDERARRKVKSMTTAELVAKAKERLAALEQGIPKDGEGGK